MKTVLQGRHPIDIFKHLNKVCRVFEAASESDVIDGVIRGLDQNFGILDAFTDKPLSRRTLEDLVKFRFENREASGA